MRKVISIILTLILCLGLFAACKPQSPEVTTSATIEKDENIGKVISPLPETLDIKNLDNCTVAVSLKKGDVCVDDSGKMVMNLNVYSYELYDMVDIASLEKDDTIVRRGKEVKITEIERLDSGLVRINKGDEIGGIDLISNDSNVYFEVGMDDMNAYYELGKVTLPVSDEFEYIDESVPGAEAKHYFPGDFLTDDAGIEYDFYQYNTSVVIENGFIIKMNKVYMP